MLESQPALSRLKDKLIDSQVTLSTLTGRYSRAHPRVQGAENSVRDLEKQIFRELNSAIANLESQKLLLAEKRKSLQSRSNRLQTRLQELAAMRAGYGQLLDEINLRKEAMSQARQELAQADAIFQAAQSTNLLTAIDEPRAGLHPVGLGRKAMILVAGIVGFCLGLGFLMIITPLPEKRDPTAGRTTANDNTATPAPRPSNPSAGTTVATVDNSDVPFSIPDITASIADITASPPDLSTGQPSESAALY